MRPCLGEQVQISPAPLHSFIPSLQVLLAVRDAWSVCAFGYMCGTCVTREYTRPPWCSCATTSAAMSEEMFGCPVCPINPMTYRFGVENAGARMTTDLCEIADILARNKMQRGRRKPGTLLHRGGIVGMRALCPRGYDGHSACFPWTCCRVCFVSSNALVADTNDKICIFQRKEASGIGQNTRYRLE